MKTVDKLKTLVQERPYANKRIVIGKDDDEKTEGDLLLPLFNAWIKRLDSYVEALQRGESVIKRNIIVIPNKGVTGMEKEYYLTSLFYYVGKTNSISLNFSHCPSEECALLDLVHTARRLMEELNRRTRKYHYNKPKTLFEINLGQVNQDEYVALIKELSKK